LNPLSRRVREADDTQQQLKLKDFTFAKVERGGPLNGTILQKSKPGHSFANARTFFAKVS
jgi:hypothetical protein